jgi:hypothetical protein
LECGTLAEPWSVKDQLFSLFFNIRLLDAHKGEDLALKPLRHILAGKDMLLSHASQLSRGEEEMSSFFSYAGSLRIAWAIPDPGDRATTLRRARQRWIGSRVKCSQDMTHKTIM